MTLKSMKNIKFFYLFVIVLLFLVGLGIWQEKLPQGTKTSLEVPNTTQIDNQNITTTSSFIEQLRQREFKGGEIKIEQTLSQEDTYTSYLISYPSDTLKIYGVMNIPKGNGSFPVIILNHGYYNPSSFTSGDGTKAIADILATNGYITVASDYRGHGKSDNDTEGRRGGHRPEYAIDVLNLIASIKSIEKADKNKIGMWGHSMGGEVALRTVEATETIKAVVLWAPTATRASDNRGFSAGRQMQVASPISDSTQDGAAPMNYLRYINTPISLHQGLSDTEVNPEGSKLLNEALKKESKQIEYFEYEGQDHNFQNLGWDVISKRTVDFYNKYLK